MFKSDRNTLISLGLLSITFIILFLTYNVGGSWSFALAFRGKKLVVLVLIAIAIATSTILFHTATQNRIITPSIMGFDALFIFIQTVLLFFMGAIQFISFEGIAKFLVEMGVMVSVFLAMFYWLFLRGNRSVYLLALTGIILGIFFRSLVNFIFRILDPNSFAVLQSELFSSFNAVETNLIFIAAPMIIACLFFVYLLRYKLEIIALGKNTAVALGVNYRATVFAMLAIIAILVAVSTALVGPITIFGLLVSHLAYQITKHQNHLNLIIISSLIAICTLVGGQFIFEKLLNMQATLSIVIECIGGITFLLILMRAHKK